MKVVSIILVLSMFILSILSIIGLIYLTEFSFNSEKSDKGMVIRDFNEGKIIFCKVTVVLLWINIALVILTQVVELVNEYNN